MERKTKKCSHCGAFCDDNAVACPKCSNAFPIESITDDPVFDGTDNKTVKIFIGKRADYYIKKFSKVKGKKTFLQLNFAALLFGQNWFFYRKMYKQAIIISVVSLLISGISLLGFALIFKTDTDLYFADKQAYMDYAELDVDRFVWDEAGNLNYNPEYDHSKYDNLEESRNRIKLIGFFSSFPVYIFNLFIRLAGNCFYKRSLIANIKINNTSKSGTSPAAVFLGIIGILALNLIISNIFLSIPVVSSFVNATHGL